jgi:hypothetical protein
MAEAIRYLVSGKGGVLPDGCRLIADGEMISLEQPWTFGAPRISRLDGAADLDALKARMTADGRNAFAVEGLEEPGDGQAFVLGGHIMQDMESFKPYAAAVPEVVRSFGGRFLARGGHVTPLGGAFVPERVVLIEFQAAADKPLVSANRPPNSGFSPISTSPLLPATVMMTPPIIASIMPR